MFTSELYKNLPDTPGVYLMKNGAGKIIYVGKAANLKRRVSSYFLRPHDSRISKLVSEIKKIDFIQTGTAIEALILEAELIKKHQPIFNIKEKDDKSFLYIEITKDKFPRVLLVRGKTPVAGERFGPFTSASSVREALRILRKIFPWSIHPPEKTGKYEKPCFDYEVGLCPGVCVGAISKADYMKNIRGLKMFLKGKKIALIKKLEKEMHAASEALEFEEALRLKRRIFALNHIQDVALISEDKPIKDGRAGERIEGYDISNTSGTSAVGSMVVFIDGEPARQEYKRFKIHMLERPNDVGMMKEMMERRVKHPWPLPDIILVDGGKAQVNAVSDVLSAVGIKIPVIGMVKGPDRKRTDLVGDFIPGADPSRRLVLSGACGEPVESVEGRLAEVNRRLLERVRDEAHRFAIGYHRAVRGKEMFR